MSTPTARWRDRTSDMARAVRNAVDSLGLDLADAIALASASPAAFLGMGDRRGRIAPGMAADLVLLGDDLTVRASWIAGRRATGSVAK